MKGKAASIGVINELHEAFASVLLDQVKQHLSGDREMTAAELGNVQRFLQSSKVTPETGLEEQAQKDMRERVERAEEQVANEAQTQWGDED